VVQPDDGHRQALVDLARRIRASRRKRIAMTDETVSVTGAALSSLLASLVARSVGFSVGIAAAILAVTALLVN
jgi:hypothetical protein